MSKRYKYEDYEAVWQHSKASGNDLLLLLALVKFRQPSGMYVTKETLAVTLNCNVDTVDRSLKRLKVLGELVWDKGSDFSKRANKYQILLPGLDLNTPANSPLVSTANSSGIPPQTQGEYPRNITPLNRILNRNENIYIDLEFDLDLGSDFRKVLVERKSELGLSVDQVNDCLSRFQKHPNFTATKDRRVQAERFLNIWLPNEVKGVPQRPQGFSIAEGDN